MIPIEPYGDQAHLWPTMGRHILACYDERAVVVYQAFGHAIADEAVRHGRFGDAFSLRRMSWIKTSFLWMMHRSIWATEPGQERVLALWIPKDALESMFTVSVETKYPRGVYRDRGEWQRALSAADVCVQWDPDRDIHGDPLQRRAIQLGLRGKVLERYAREWLGGVEDITPHVVELRERRQREDAMSLAVPRQRVYVPASPGALARLSPDRH